MMTPPPSLEDLERVLGGSLVAARFEEKKVDPQAEIGGKVLRKSLFPFHIYIYTLVLLGDV